MAGQVKKGILSKKHAPACSEGTDIQFTQLRDFGSQHHLIRQSRTDLDRRHEFTFAVWQIVIRSSFADASFSPRTMRLSLGFVASIRAWHRYATARAGLDAIGEVTR